MTSEGVGRAADPGSGGAGAPTRGAAPANVRGAFAVALALARGRAAERGPRASASAGAGAKLPPPALPLARRRLGADEGAAALRDRRDEAEPGKPASPQRPACERAQEQAAVEAPRRIFAPAALDRVLLEVGRLGERPSVEVRLAADVGVRLTRAPHGVEVVLSVAPSRRRDGEAELPALVAALRARGVKLARAEVRTLAGPSPGGARALTAARASDTRAHPRQ